MKNETRMRRLNILIQYFWTEASVLTEIFTSHYIPIPGQQPRPLPIHSQMYLRETAEKWLCWRHFGNKTGAHIPKINEPFIYIAPLMKSRASAFGFLVHINGSVHCRLNIINPHKENGTELE